MLSITPYIAVPQSSHHRFQVSRVALQAQLFEMAFMGKRPKKKVKPYSFHFNPQFHHAVDDFPAARIIFKDGQPPWVSPLTQQAEQVLHRQIMERDRRAFLTLVTAHQDLMLKEASQHGLKESEFPNLLDRMFEKLLNCQYTYNPRVPWEKRSYAHLVQTLVPLAIIDLQADQLQSTRSLNPLSIPFPEDSGSLIDPLALKVYLDCIPPEHRALYILGCLRGLSDDTISQQLGLTLDEHRRKNHGAYRRLLSSWLETKAPPSDPGYRHRFFDATIRHRLTPTQQLKLFLGSPLTPMERHIAYTAILYNLDRYKTALILRTTPGNVTVRVQEARKKMLPLLKQMGFWSWEEGI